MSVHIRYMGTKQSLAPIVAEIIKELPDGPCLDLFAGMCSVAGSLARVGRETWCNDVQKYAALVSNVLIASTEAPVGSNEAVVKLLPAFKRNRSSLLKRFAQQLEEEGHALNQESLNTYRSLADSWRHAGNDDHIANEILSLQSYPRFPYRLTTLSYSYGYFGLSQAIDIDSLRYAIDFCFREGALTKEQTQWCLTALLETASKVSTAPGHFAQYLEAKNKSSYKHIRAQRKRNVWNVFLESITTILPFGTQAWRSKNKTFCSDAMYLPNQLLGRQDRPRVIYADPPYSEAQYSRYYHVLESLVEYDYPSIKSKGRYRSDRFSTPFSLISSVGNSFTTLVEKSASLEADLIISYPSNGLLFQKGRSLVGILKEFYSSVKVINIKHKHSTLGGKHGVMKSDVEELIFIGRRPRQ